jgi:hypothetical protein
MAQPGTFGRRPAPASAERPLARPSPTQTAPAQSSSFRPPASAQSEGIFARAQAEAAAAARLALLPPHTGDGDVDTELAEWKATRKGAFKLPWRQLSLIASLCFGIASFVLPDGVNDMVNWLLYGLMAMSFYVGITGKKAKKTKA